MSVLGIYKRDAFNKTLRVGTPDPCKYHDAGAVRLEGANEAAVAAKLPPNEKFTLPGVVIPHAKREGGSMGWDSEKPMKVFIDPEQTGGQIQVDIADIRRNPGAMAEAIREAFSQHAEHEDAIVEAFARFSKGVVEPKKLSNTYVHVEQSEVREAPLQMRGSYVAPKASPGGGQMKAASFSKKPDIQEFNPKEEFDPGIAQKAAAAAIAASRQGRSLHEELVGPNVAISGSSSRGMRKVTFELPNHKGDSLGQFACFYHDVVIEDANLVLVYDHNHPSQMIWFPPALENSDSGEPLSIAVLVHGLHGESDTLYLAYPTGVKFRYRNEEFCLLTVDKSKEMGK